MLGTDWSFDGIEHRGWFGASELRSQREEVGRSQGNRVRREVTFGGGRIFERPVATSTLTPPETMMFSVPRRSQRTLLLFSVVVCIQIYSVLAESTVLGGQPIYVSSHTAFLPG